MPTWQRWVRWLVPPAILIALGLAFHDQLDFIEQAVRELRDAHLTPILIASAAAFASLAAMGEVMRLLMAAGGTRVALSEATAITLASNAWSTTLPAGPAFSAVLTFQVQRRWGASVVLCGWFFVISSVISTMWLTVIGLAAVLLGANLGFFSLATSLAVTVAITWSIFWASSRPDVLERWTRAAFPWFNRLLRREPDAGQDSVVKQLHSLSTVQLSGAGFARVSLFSLLNRLLDATVLWLSIWAVTGDLPGLAADLNQTTLMGVLLAYITAKLAGSAQVTPAGLGTVEAAIIATLVATGMTAVDATGAAIVYRAVSFALVTLIGWIIYFLHYARDGFAGPAQLRDQID